MSQRRALGLLVAMCALLGAAFVALGPAGLGSAYGRPMRREHPFTIGRTVLLAALLAGVLTWLRVGDDEGDGAVILPLLALPAGACVGYFIGLALYRE